LTPRSATHEELENALARVLPGFEVLDSELELSDVLTAALVGVDGMGHAVAVVRVEEGAADTAVLIALDALAFLDRNAQLLPEHLSSARVRPELAPRVVLVAEEFDDAVHRRLAPLLGERVELCELRVMTSAAGRRTYLVRLGAEGTPMAPGGAEAAEALFAALPEPSRLAGELLLGRMDRMDEELSLAVDGGQLTWQLGGEVVARLEADAGGLRGSIPPARDLSEVAGTGDAEAFVERAMGRYAALLTDREPPPKGNGTPREAPLPADEKPAFELPPASEPLLTAEELEAFRD
jgi:hypothetical protein